MKEKLIYALAEALEMEPTEIKPEDEFRQFKNYGSLAELSVLAMLDADFGVALEMQEYNTYKTVNDLINLCAK